MCPYGVVMDILIIIGLLITLLAGALVALRIAGKTGVYVYIAGVTGALYAMDFMQVVVFGQLLFVAEVFFAANFLITDMIEEHYGKSAARKVIPIVLGVWVFIWALTYLGTKLNPAEYDPFHAPLTEIVSFYTPQTMLLIVCIYSLLVFVDTYLYQKIRDVTQGKHLWMRNIGSTLVTQTVDVLVSYGILIMILFPELSTAEMISAMIAAGVFKYSMALIDTPFVYLSYYFKPKD